MDIVERPVHLPGHCIATLTSEDPKGFVDTGLTPALIDPRVYVSVSWIEECARKLGFVDGDTHDDALRRIADLETEVREADEFAQAAEYTLGRFGERVRRKPGRKPKGDDMREAA